MREDMFKVIVERPRWGSRHATKTKLRYDKCEGRSRVTGRRLASETGYRKSLNENLAPLKRYLHKQIGRRWDDVFSEICKHLDTGSTVKMHVREHLDDFVDWHVRIKPDGELWTSQGWGGETKLIDSWVELYVDPDDGRIKETRALCKKHGVLFARNRWRQARRSQSNTKNVIQKAGHLQWFVRLHGVWYRIQLSKKPSCAHGYGVSDGSLHKELTTHQWREHERWSVVHKKQLSSKQLKAQNLSNECRDVEGYYG